MRLRNWDYHAVAAAAKLLQSCPTVCDPIDGSPVPGILQARTLEWVAISFSNAWKWEVKLKSLSHVWLLATSWTAAHQAPLSMGFPRQEYWSGVPSPSPILLAASSKTTLEASPWAEEMRILELKTTELFQQPLKLWEWNKSQKEWLLSCDKKTSANDCEERIHAFEKIYLEQVGMRR